MVEAMGFAHYRDNYTDQQLWNMLVTDGDAWSVEQSAGVWRTARSGLETARGALNTNLAELSQYWQGPASDEFQNRMLLVHDYSAAVEERMRSAETQDIPAIASALQLAQDRAQGANALGESLSPYYDIEDPDEWMHQVKGLSNEQIAVLDPQTRTSHTNEHTAWRQARHDELAQAVAALGEQYTAIANERFAEPAAPPPDGMPGNTTYQQPASGVFTSDGPSASTPSSSSLSTGSTGTTTGSSGGDNDVAPAWNLPSYTDIDEPSGGLAGGGTTMPQVSTSGPSVSPVATGGGNLGAGPGLFSPGPVGGAGSAPGRGPNATNPVRGTQTGRPGVQPNTTGRNSGAQHGNPNRAGTGRGNLPASGQRRGDEFEEEETTARESKYVEAEDLFAAPFDPTVGPAHEGPKYQREWNKQYDKWKREQEDSEEA